MRLEIWNSNHKVAEAWVNDEARVNHIRAVQFSLIQEAMKKGHEPMDCGFKEIRGAVVYSRRVVEDDL